MTPSHKYHYHYHLVVETKNSFVHHASYTLRGPRVPDFEIGRL